ncbi:MAG: hypothetical protein JSR63_07850 [Proteobacteria bacterium]|nr:hypothetical protein [Pseudomonadota bacterium]
MNPALLGPLAPYAVIIGWVVRLLIPVALVGGGFAWGHSGVSERDDKIAALGTDLANATASAGLYRDAFTLANTGLLGARNTFLELEADYKLQAADGELNIATGQRVAAEAVKENAALHVRIDALNRKVKELSTGCVNAARPVCGVLE